MNRLKVKVTSYKQNLIIETINKKEDKNFIPVGPGRFGSILIRTNKVLGMSKQAVTLLKTIKKGNDNLGDVCTWSTSTNDDCFNWIGNLNRIVDMNDSEGDKYGIINIKHITIENDIPYGAKYIIDHF